MSSDQAPNYATAHCTAIGYGTTVQTAGGLARNVLQDS